jgi:hypothetical protein
VIEIAHQPRRGLPTDRTVATNTASRSEPTGPRPKALRGRVPLHKVRCGPCDNVRAGALARCCRNAHRRDQLADDSNCVTGRRAHLPGQLRSHPSSGSAGQLRWDGRAAGHGQPTPGAGASATRTWPVLAFTTSSIASVPRHSAVSMNSVRRSGLPSIAARAGRSSSIVSRTSPCSRMRAQSLIMAPLEAQTHPSVSRQMPSGPTPSAQTRRFDRVPSSATSKAVSRASTC